VPYLGAPPPALLRAGDTKTNPFGVIEQGQISSDAALIDYLLHPLSTLAPVFTAANPRAAGSCRTRTAAARSTPPS